MTTGTTKQKKAQVSSMSKSKEEPKKKKSSVSSIFASKEDPKAKKSSPGAASHHHKEEPKPKKSTPVASTTAHKEESKAKKPTMSSMLKSKDTEPKRSIFTKDRTHPERSHSTKDTTFKPAISKPSGSLSDPEKSTSKHPKGIKKVKKAKA